MLPQCERQGEHIRHACRYGDHQSESPFHAQVHLQRCCQNAVSGTCYDVTMLRPTVKVLSLPLPNPVSGTCYDVTVLQPTFKALSTAQVHLECHCKSAVSGTCYDVTMLRPSACSLYEVCPVPSTAFSAICMHLCMGEKGVDSRS
jgi:hypothetical protein